MPNVLADVLKLKGSSYPDKAVVESNYQIGEKLYLEYDYKLANQTFAKAVAEFEVTGIVLNTLVKPHEVMLDVMTNDEEYLVRLPEDQKLLLFEADMNQYLAKNTELLHEMRGQLAASGYTQGKEHANVTLDNGRVIAINEIRDENKTVSGQYRVSLYANSEEIQTGIFRENGYIVREHIGNGSVDFLYQSLKDLVKVNGDVKTPEEKYIEQEEDITDSFENSVVKKPEDSNCFVITNSAGESIELSVMEFWNVVNFGSRLNTRDEVENYISDCDMIGSIPAHLIAQSRKAINRITEKVMDERIGNETGDQIYEAAEGLKKELAALLYDDILHEADFYIDQDEEYYGMKGSDLSEAGALKIITDYILSHNMYDYTAFSDKVYHAIFECEEILKAHLEALKNKVFDEKSQLLDNSKKENDAKQKNHHDFER